MNEDLSEYQDHLELICRKEYMDLLPTFNYIVETADRTYLCNGTTFWYKDGEFIIELDNCWVLDMYRQPKDRFVTEVTVINQRVSIEKLREVPDEN